VPGYRTVVTFRDKKGQTAKTSFYSTGADLAAALANAQATVPLVEAVSAGAVSSVHGLAETPPTAITYATTAAKYDNAEDKAELVFTDAEGGVHRYQIPIPKDGVFLADDETVNVAQADVAALIANFIGGTVTSRNGIALTGFLGGIRLRKRTQKRFSISTKNPTLTGPGL
jgi:hypothetical protein